MSGFKPSAGRALGACVAVLCAAALMLLTVEHIRAARDAHLSAAHARLASVAELAAPALALALEHAGIGAARRIVAGIEPTPGVVAAAIVEASLQVTDPGHIESANAGAARLESGRLLLPLSAAGTPATLRIEYDFSEELQAIRHGYWLATARSLAAVLLVALVLSLTHRHYRDRRADTQASMASTTADEASDLRR